MGEENKETIETNQKLEEINLVDKNKKGKNKTVLFAIIVISICILGVGGYLVYDKLLDKPSKGGENTTTTTTSSVTASKEEEPFLNILRNGFWLSEEEKDSNGGEIKYEWKEASIPPKTKLKSFVDSLDDLKSNFNEFNTRFMERKYDEEDNERWGVKTFTFSLKDNTFTYKHKSGFTQSIENVKAFKYLVNDDDHWDDESYDLFVITENGELWKFVLPYTNQTDQKDKVLKFEKIDGEYSDIKYYDRLNGMTTTREYVYVDKNKEHYYLQSGGELNKDFSIDAGDSSYIDIYGNVYYDDNKVDIKYKNSIVLYGSDLDSDDGSIFVGIIDEENYLWICGDDGWVKYPSKIIKVYFHKDDHGLKLECENRKNFYSGLFSSVDVSIYIK